MYVKYCYRGHCLHLGAEKNIIAMPRNIPNSESSRRLCLIVSPRICMPLECLVNLNIRKALNSRITLKNTIDILERLV